MLIHFFKREPAMRRTNRILWCVTVLVTALTAGVAFTQEKGKGRGGFGGGGNSLVTLAANEGVQKDIGLSGDVVAKLTSLRDDYRAAAQKEYQNAGISFQGLQNMSREERRAMTEKIAGVDRKLSDEFNPKLKALVSADQFKR